MPSSPCFTILFARSLSPALLLSPPQGCLNTSAPEGAAFPVDFVVFSADTPPAVATATRTIQIGPPCPPGQSFCDGACLAVSCSQAAQAAALAAASAPLPPPPPPPPPLIRVLAPQNVTLTFGQPAPAGLRPCPANDSSAAWPACAAVASDPSSGADLSSSLQLSQVGLAPMPCSPQGFAQCLPGVYTFGFAVPGRPGPPTPPALLSLRLAERSAVPLALSVPLPATLNASAARAEAAALAAAGGSGSGAVARELRRNVSASLTAPDLSVWCDEWDVSVVSAAAVRVESGAYELVRKGVLPKIPLAGTLR